MKMDLRLTAQELAGHGRCWRASGHTTNWPPDGREAAEALLRVMELSTAGSRLIPEQVWDAPDIPERELFRGKPTGSACPLVWAHSEYIKLRRSMRDGKIFDQPPQTVQRYQVEGKKSAYFGWCFNNKTRSMPPGKKLRLVLLEAALVHWSLDDWRTTQDISTRDTGLGVYCADLPTDDAGAGAERSCLRFCGCIRSAGKE